MVWILCHRRRNLETELGRSANRPGKVMEAEDRLANLTQAGIFAGSGNLRLPPRWPMNDHGGRACLNGRNTF